MAPMERPGRLMLEILDRNFCRARRQTPRRVSRHDGNLGIMLKGLRWTSAGRLFHKDGARDRLMLQNVVPTLDRPEVPSEPQCYGRRSRSDAALQSLASFRSAIGVPCRLCRLKRLDGMARFGLLRCRREAPAALWRLLHCRWLGSFRASPLAARLIRRGRVGG